MIPSHFVSQHLLCSAALPVFSIVNVFVHFSICVIDMYVLVICLLINASCSN